MKIIVGLGNPGVRYRRTRHNFGFMAVGALADLRHMRFRRGRSRSTQARGRLGKEEVVLVRPMTYMNRSGESVAGVLKHFSRPLEDLLVVSDDVNLDLGRIRLRRSGSSGGHRGLDSILQQLGSGDFARLRLGVGAPPEALDMMDYVLRGFRRDEWPVVREVLLRATQAMETWVYHGVDEAMNRFN